MSELSLDDRHRDTDGRISRKHGDELIRNLRRTFGAGFAPQEDMNSQLGVVLHRLDEPSLTKLIADLDQEASQGIR
jgi:hypothetical protein